MRNPTITFCPLTFIIGIALFIVCCSQAQAELRSNEMEFYSPDIYSYDRSTIHFDKRRESSKKKNEHNKKKKAAPKKKQTKSTSSSKKVKSRDCSEVLCALKLKKCPKACPLSCGYVDSPDPCCPLLGKPVCPKH